MGNSQITEKILLANFKCRACSFNQTCSICFNLLTGQSPGRISGTSQIYFCDLKNADTICMKLHTDKIVKMGLQSCRNFLPLLPSFYPNQIPQRTSVSYSRPGDINVHLIQFSIWKICSMSTLVLVYVVAMDNRHKFAISSSNMKIRQATTISRV